MNRKQKIIVSVVGITIVLLALLGLTYAYFLTRIQGNTNDKSISVTTADLKLVYGDGSDGVIGEENLLPSDTVYTKTFTVKNEGNANVEYGVYLIDVINTFERLDDIKYTLNCTTNGTIACNEVTTETTFPNGISQLITNEIEPKKTHTYTFKFTYKDTNTDQSVDMGKVLQAKLQIFGKNSNGEFVPYEEGTLSYNIINNTKNNLNGTELVDTPKTKPAEEISTKWGTAKFGTETVTTESLCSGYNPWLVGDTETAAQSGSRVSSYEEAVGKYVHDGCSQWTKYLESYDASSNTLNFRVEIYDYEKNMSVAIDDYGTSYYYRGNVIDNYLNFAGMCWRIVRIAGDGSVKLILEDQDEECSKTMDGNWDIPTTTGGTVKVGNFGYTKYAANTLTASDGTKNSYELNLINYLNGKTDKDKSMATAFKNFQTGSLANYLDKLKAGDWCLNDKAYAAGSDYTTALTSQEILDRQINRGTIYYDSNVRLNIKTTKEPTLKCNGTNMKKFADNTDMYVGALTVDEIIYAGGKVYTSNRDYYLINDYQESHVLSFSSLSLYDSIDSFKRADTYFYVGSRDYRLEGMSVEYAYFRPAIALATGTKISGGDGTIGNPYKILEN